MKSLCAVENPPSLHGIPPGRLSAPFTCHIAVVRRPGTAEPITKTALGALIDHYLDLGSPLAAAAQAAVSDCEVCFPDTLPHAE